MSSFQQMFSYGPTDEGDGEKYERPIWLGPPEAELGVTVQQGIVIGRSERAVVALRHVTAYSTGLTLDFLAIARDLRQTEANRLFHEQHLLDEEEGPSDAFLRVGVELSDGARISNLGNPHRDLWRPDSEPGGPLLVPSGGGGGSAGMGQVTMQPGYWLWPLPPPGSLTFFVEWPALGIALSTVEIDADVLRSAASGSQRIWSNA